MFAQVVGEALDVEPKTLGVCDQVVRLERVLMVQQHVVQLPEGVLSGRRLGCLRCELRVRVDVAQRQVPPDVADVAELLQQCAHEGLGLATVRTLEVAVFDDGDRRHARTAEVIPLGVNVLVEVDELLRCPEEGADARAPGQQRRQSKQQPGEKRRRERGAENADLRFLELVPVERERCDQQGDREADSCDRSAAGDRDPADGRAQSPPAQPGHQPGAPEDSNRLADHVAEQDPERDRRRERACQEAAVQRDAGVREREQGDDHVAGPRMQQLLQSLVRRGGSSELRACDARQLCGGLLAELSEPLGHELELGPRGRKRVREQPPRAAVGDRVGRVGSPGPGWPVALRPRPG